MTDYHATLCVHLGEPVKWLHICMAVTYVTAIPRKHIHSSLLLSTSASTSQRHAILPLCSQHRVQPLLIHPYPQASPGNGKMLPNRKCCTMGNLDSTSTWYIFSMPEFTCTTSRIQQADFRLSCSNRQACLILILLFRPL